MKTRVFRQIPSYRLHKASGSAVVTLHGHDHYLGRYGTEASKSEYRRLIAEWLANDCVPSPTPGDDQATGISVNEVLAGFYLHAKGYYRKDGRRARSTASEPRSGRSRRSTAAPPPPGLARWRSRPFGRS